MVAALGRAADRIITTRSSHARAVDADGLAALARAAGSEARAVADPRAALAAAREQAGPEGVVVVAGSLYLLADLRPQIVQGEGNPPATLARALGGNAPTEAN